MVLKKVRALAMQLSGARAFQAEGTDNAKVLSRHAPWWLRETTRRPE